MSLKKTLRLPFSDIVSFRSLCALGLSEMKCCRKRHNQTLSSDAHFQSSLIADYEAKLCQLLIVNQQLLAKVHPQSAEVGINTEDDEYQHSMRLRVINQDLQRRIRSLNDQLQKKQIRITEIQSQLYLARPKVDFTLQGTKSSEILVPRLSKIQRSKNQQRPKERSWARASTANQKRKTVAQSKQYFAGQVKQVTEEQRRNFIACNQLTHSQTERLLCSFCKAVGEEDAESAMGSVLRFLVYFVGLGEECFGVRRKGSLLDAARRVWKQLKAELKGMAQTKWSDE